jgi:low temperature requirement protein LtrA
VASEPERHIAQTADRASTKSVARPRRPVAPLEQFYDLVFVFEIFILIALGETIALTGVTATLLGFDAGRLAAFALAFISTACLYWLYFDGFPPIARQRLERGPNGIQLARDAYMFLHVVIVAGVILSAVGDGVVIEGPTDILSGAEVAVVCAGPALYLLGHVLFRLRMTGRISWIRLSGRLLAPWSA